MEHRAGNDAAVIAQLVADAASDRDAAYGDDLAARAYADRTRTRKRIADRQAWAVADSVRACNLRKRASSVNRDRHHVLLLAGGIRIGKRERERHDNRRPWKRVPVPRPVPGTMSVPGFMSGAVTMSVSGIMSVTMSVSGIVSVAMSMSMAQYRSLLVDGGMTL